MMAPSIRVEADPGICGFPCVIEARKEGPRAVSLKIIGSECEHIKRLSEDVVEMGLRDLFKPITKNPVYISAQQAGCHPSCPVPVAVLKAVEVAMDMALPKDVYIKFKK
jgi:hypothetical protein